MGKGKEKVLQNCQWVGSGWCVCSKLHSTKSLHKMSPQKISNTIAFQITVFMFHHKD